MVQLGEGREGKERSSTELDSEQQLDIRGLASQHNPLKMLSLLHFLHFQKMYQCSFVPFVRVLGHEAFNLAGFCHRRVVMVFLKSCNDVIEVNSRCTVQCLVQSWKRVAAPGGLGYTPPN